MPWYESALIAMWHGYRDIDAAAVGNATARSILYANRDKQIFLYPNSSWEVGFIGGSHEFQIKGVRLLDARTRFFYYATDITASIAASTTHSVSPPTRR